MLIHIAHSWVYRYDPPAAGAIQVLRLTPRNYEGQYVVNWRIDVTPDARLAAHEDAFGNITHVFTADGPLEELRVEVEGRVETQNTDGIVRGTVERFPPSLFLRDTALTEADTTIRVFAEAARAAGGGTVLGDLHELLHRMHDDIVQANPGRNAAASARSEVLKGQSQDADVSGNDAQSAATDTAAEAFALRRRAARDLAHIFIAAAHSLGIPARFVAGYVRGADGAVQHAGHAWAEAFVPDLGWVGFDPANGFCPSDAHVRVAIGLDGLGAGPMRGTRRDTGAETVAVTVRVDQ